MPKSHFGKILRAQLSEYDLPGYVRLIPLCYVSESNSVLRIINFDLGTAGFNCSLSLQPLVVPNTNGLIALSYDINLALYAGLQFKRWPYGETKEETKSIVGETIDLLKRVGLPWFERYGSEQGIVNYPVEDGSLMHTPPEIRSLYRGFCALHIGLVQKGTMWLEEAMLHYKKFDYDYCQKTVHEIEDALRVARGNPDLLKEYLDEIVKSSRDAVVSANLHDATGR